MFYRPISSLIRFPLAVPKRLLIAMMIFTAAAACSLFSTALENRYKTATALRWGISCVRENESIGLAIVVEEAISPLGFSPYGSQPQLVSGRRLFSYGIGAGPVFAKQRIDVFVSEPDRSVNVIDYQTPKESTYVLEVLDAIGSHVAQRCGGQGVEWKQYQAPDIT
jgi:hypothetical protein